MDLHDPLVAGLRPTLRIEIGDTTQIAAARRSAIELARELGFDEENVGRAALITTEAASNVFKHAGGGEVLLAARTCPAPGLEVIAIDDGPGFDVPTARADGFSTTGTLGQGLGAMQRIASELHVHSVHGRGTVLRALLCAGPPAEPPGFEYGVVCLPHPGESVCGDGWLCLPHEGGVLLSVIDGLGHGPLAHEAVKAAVHAAGDAATGVERYLDRAHAAMRSTRGAAMAAAQVDLVQGHVRCAGVGNIAAMLIGHGGNKHFVSMAGIMGHNVRKMREFDQPWNDASVLVMHSDGLGTHWSLAAEPGLLEQHPSIIAAWLYRHHSRGRDDVTVLVARRRA